jgi:hypothetical protein
VQFGEHLLSHKILSYLDVNTLMRVACVSTAWRDVSEHERVWRRFAKHIDIGERGD